MPSTTKASSKLFQQSLHDFKNGSFQIKEMYPDKNPGLNNLIRKLKTITNAEINKNKYVAK